MSESVSEHKLLILGESGFGKTASLRNLDPKTTGIINIDRKPLPIPGWKKKYITVPGEGGRPDLSKSNYVETSRPASVLATLEAWSKRDDIATIVIDTITHLITSDYMENAIGKDFKGYQSMGKNFYRVIDLVRDIHKNVLVFGHTVYTLDDNGNKVMAMASQGNMIKGLVPPSYFTTVLVAEVVRGKDTPPQYVFRTQSDGNDPAKSPAYFKGNEAQPALDLREPNDSALILNKLTDFES